MGFGTAWLESRGDRCLALELLCWGVKLVFEKGEGDICRLWSCFFLGGEGGG